MQYFDKGRLEDNAYRAQPPWDVTSGLLARELITGRLQLGDEQFQNHPLAQVNVAGDAGDPNGPTYATFNTLMGYHPLPDGWTLIQTVDRAGQVGADPSLARYAVRAAEHVRVPGIDHQIASVFWDFMHSSGVIYQNGDTTGALFPNPFYATGYPLTEAYWTHVLVGGTSKLVLVQVFERRVLTYTPDNPEGWQVEAGNVGQHYFAWHYGQLGMTPQPPRSAPPSYTPPQPPQPHQIEGGTIMLPAGFTIGLFASGLGSPRFMAVRPSDGLLFATDMSGGRILILPDANHDGQADQAIVFASGLDRPSSLAFYQDWLYVGEPGQVVRYHAPAGALAPDSPPQVVVPNLPSDGEHFTRTVAFSPDGHLFISVGSSCNICVESDNRRAAILVANADGSQLRLYATGLRNAVGLAFQPGTNQLWASDNERDELGDNVPPDVLQRVEDGVFYGWPYCYNGDHPQPEFDDPGKCAGVPPDTVALPAHSAPLGLTFGSGLRAPAPYQDSIYIAYHGSWNRSVPTGYKVVRVPVVNGQPQAPEDFAWGWLPGTASNPGQVWGRPVGVTVGADGALYVSDDSSGLIYRIAYAG
ncbi:MAG TPA: PQQ-dependent sugar dehydrogenase [Thermomicrobiaceae bacterium]|nr:PQQ-dependent sugar dehydrogenase [Thermomicrobiaceae bacterium]